MDDDARKTLIWSVVVFLALAAAFGLWMLIGFGQMMDFQGLMAGMHIFDRLILVAFWSAPVLIVLGLVYLLTRRRR